SMSKRSRVWNFFYKESDTVARCCLCHKNYSRKGRGTTCLRNHLKSKHPCEFQTLSETDFTYRVKTEMSDSKSSRSHLQLQVQVSSPGSNADPLEEFNAIDRSLALMIAQSDQSFNMIEGVGFMNLIKTLQPRYTLNPISYYVNIICQDVHQRMHSHLMQELTNLDSLTLATSLHCCDGSGPGLLTLSGYGISNDFQAREFHLKCQPMDEDHMTDISGQVHNIIASAIVELQLPKEKIHCIIRDERTSTQLTQIECSISLLKLCVKSALDANEQLTLLDAKCVQIVKHFQQSQIAHNQLKYIHEKHLSRTEFPSLFDYKENPQKWNSIFQLKASLLQVKDALSIYGEEHSASVMVNIYPDEWLDIELGNRVIQPIEEIIGIWHKSKSSSVIPLIAALRDSLRSDIHNYVSSMASLLNIESLTICSFARKLLEELELKYSSVSRDIKYLMATYLDPRYKQAFFNQQEAQLVTDEVLTQLTSIQSQGWQPPAKIKNTPNAQVKSESKIDSFLDNMLTLGHNNLNASNTLPSQTQLTNLLYLYNSEPRIDRQSNPIIWWKSNPKYTALFPIVRKYLAIPAASIYSESLFSVSTNLYSDWLTWDLDLSYENVCKILFVKANF
ncbi:hypothetical protein KR044_013377, partial [Drosophila immigrans]